MKRIIILSVGILILVGVLLAVRDTPLAQLFNPESLRAAVEGAGSLGPILFVCVYILACLLFFPGTPLTLLGGVLFGPLLGIVYTLIGATLGAWGAFAFSRFFGSTSGVLRIEAVRNNLGRYDQALRDNGFMTVLFLRFVPLFPFNGLNFALGLTSITMRDYVLGTCLGIIPGTAVLVFFGDSLASVDIIKSALAALGLVGLYLLGRYCMRIYGRK
jgi:uncharacterized membrane protein YdjX (TVP38/TMEM64 family)